MRRLLLWAVIVLGLVAGCIVAGVARIEERPLAPDPLFNGWTDIIGR